MNPVRTCYVFLAGWLLLLPLAVEAQTWVSARRKPGPEAGAWAWVKVVAEGKELPFYVVFESGTETVSTWRWMSDTGGRLRWFHTQGTDSLLLEGGQQQCKAEESGGEWALKQGSDNLLLRRADEGWQVVQMIPPQQPGQRPVAVPLVKIIPHPKRAHRFRIEYAGLLEDLPEQLLLLGIVLAVADS